jgi:hypothetical protein
MAQKKKNALLRCKQAGRARETKWRRAARARVCRATVFIGRERDAHGHPIEDLATWSVRISSVQQEEDDITRGASHHVKRYWTLVGLLRLGG